MIGKISKEYLYSIPESSIQWVYNILDGTKEVENRVMDHPVEEYKDDAYILMKDLKFHEGDIRSLYLNTYVYRRDLKSLRDLNETHLDMLESMYNDGLEAISEKFKVAKNTIAVFIHYLPTYYHLHIHFCHQKYMEGYSANIGK